MNNNTVTMIAKYRHQERDNMRNSIPIKERSILDLFH